MSSRHRRRSSNIKNNSNQFYHSEQLTDIPEYANAIYGQDRNKVRLPVFGNLLKF